MFAVGTGFFFYSNSCDVCPWEAQFKDYSCCWIKFPFLPSHATQLDRHSGSLTRCVMNSRIKECFFPFYGMLAHSKVSLTRFSFAVTCSLSGPFGFQNMTCVCLGVGRERDPDFFKYIYISSQPKEFQHE